MRKPWLAMVGLVLLVVSAGAVAQTADAALTPEQRVEQREAWGKQRLELVGSSLAKSDQPRTLYAAWLVEPITQAYMRGNITNAPEVDERLLRAYRIGSNDPLIAAAMIDRCIRMDKCDVEEAVASLRVGDVDNAGSQLLLLRLAEHQKDPAEAHSAWQRVAKAKSYRDPVTATIGLLSDATHDVAWPPSDPAQLEAWLQDPKIHDAEQDRLATVLGIAVNRFPADATQVSEACMPPGLSAEKSQQCRHLLTVMAGSSSLLMARLGAARMAELEVDPVARVEWSARYRELEWIHSAGTYLLGEGAEQTNAKVSVGELVQWLTETGELSATRHLLTLCRVSPHPPADWKVPPPTEPSTYRLPSCR